MPEYTKRPPDGLGPDGRRLWRQITSEYALEAQDPVRLETACRMADVAARARAEVTATGEYLTDKSGKRYPNPGLTVGRQAHIVMLRAIREMNVDVAAAGDIGRPPALSGRSFLRRGA